MDLTLEQLARIALGNEHLCPTNLTVLHSLIEFLLNKLGCGDEKVKIGGYESNILKKMLSVSKPSSLVLQTNKPKLFTEQFERFTKLEKRVESVQKRVNRHLEEIFESNKHNIGGIYDYQNWQHFSGAYEDICMKCEPINSLACDLVNNVHFMTKMLRRISLPVVEGFLSFEEKLDRVSNDFTRFIDNTEKHYFKVALVERCIQDIDHLYQEVENSRSLFISAMEEVQDMLDHKLDKSQLPVLKTYVREHYEEIENLLRITRSTSLSDAGQIMDGIICLSCGNQMVCVEKAVKKACMPEAHKKYDPKALQSFICPKQGSMASKLHVSTSSHNVGMININLTNTLPRSSNEHKYVLKRGKNKIMYRMALKKECEEKTERAPIQRSVKTLCT